MIVYTNERHYKRLKRLSLAYTIIDTEEKYCLYFDSGAFIDKNCKTFLEIYRLMYIYTKLFTDFRFCVGDHFYLFENKILCGPDYEET